MLWKKAFVDRMGLMASRLQDQFVLISATSLCDSPRFLLTKSKYSSVFTRLIHAMQEHKEGFEQHKTLSLHIKCSTNKERNPIGIDHTAKKGLYIL